MKYKSKPKQEDILVPGLPPEYFSIQEFKSAVWQYLIDHSTYVDENLFKVVFYTPNEADFWWRVKARKDGVFKRKELADLQERMDRKHRVIQELRRTKNKYEAQLQASQNWENRLKFLEENGKLHQKIMLKIGRKFKIFGRNLTNKALGIK